MATVLDELSKSEDAVDRELSRVLRVFQSVRASQNRPRNIGYEPRDIQRFGAVGVIERRIRNMSSGFDEVPAKDSYEAIVQKYPDRFNGEVVAIALARLGQEQDEFGPTDDPAELDRRVKKLLDRTHLPFPKKGIESPPKVTKSAMVFARDPRVKAFVLKRARGRCEACQARAPFKTPAGLDYLEVHHMKALAEGGSDRVENAVALCPNCHRAMHHASNAAELADGLYKRIAELVRE